MLKRTKKDENNYTSLPEEKPLQEKAVPPVLRPSINEELNRREQTTTIGDLIFIEGTIRGEENLTLNGTMKGNIDMGKHNFTIGVKGRVEGEIHARDVNIDGQFKGTIRAQGKVAVTKAADFNGEIKAKSFSVEDGAYFKGAVELDREPHQKPAAANVPAGPLSSQPLTQPVKSAAEAGTEK